MRRAAPDPPGLRLGVFTMRFLSLPIVAVAAFALAAPAGAVVVQVPVTAAYLREHPKAFAIQAEKRDDGLLHFTITHRLDEPRYLVAHFALREGGATVAQTHFPAFV